MTGPAPLAPWRRAADGVIGLWVAPVADLLAAEKNPETALPEAERAHCRRYGDPEARRRALAVRLLAHRALAWLDPAQSWSIAHRAGGQPHLSDTTLAISLAHSGEWVACALGRVAALGVDLEALQPRPRLLAFARRFYSGREVSGLERLGDAERLRAFHDIWTLREAWLKARGLGLADYRRAPCTREALAGRVPGWEWRRWTQAPDCHVALCWQRDASSQVEKPLSSALV